MKRIAVILSIALSLALCTFAGAQSVTRASGTYTYVIPEEESIQMAKQRALTLCRIKILADNFGTSITSTEFSQIGAGEDRYLHIAESEVNGEWLGNIGEPEYTKSVSNDHFVLTVSVTGKIRRIERAQTDIFAALLHDPDNLKSVGTEFRSGDYFYLYFRTPVKGNLLVYAADQSIAQCVLPYPAQYDKVNLPVKARSDYVFFSLDHSYDETPDHVIRQMMHQTSREIEQSRVYVIFSPNEFTRPNASSVDGMEQLSFRDFQKWLSKARQQDKKMVVKELDITVKQ